MNLKLIAPLLCALALSLSGCGDAGGGGSSPTADQGKSLQEVEQTAQAADASSLEATIASYQKAVDEQVKKVEAAMAKAKELDPGELLSEAGSKLTAEADAAQKELTALKNKLQVYTQELAKKKP